MKFLIKTCYSFPGSISLIFSLGLVFVLLLSCEKSKNENHTRFEERELDEVLKYSIYKKIKHKVGLDSNGNSLWTRVERIKEFNKKGKLIYEIIPKYFSIEYDLTDVDVFTKLKLLAGMSETNDPTGEVDSIKYFYNEKGKLQEKISEYGTKINYKYNSNGDRIEECFYSDMDQFICKYSKYAYDNDGNIISRVDSVGEIGKVRQRSNPFSGKVQRFEYQYDVDGRLIFDGDEGWVFDDLNQIVEVYWVENGLKKQVISNKYDDEGKLVSSISRRAVSWMTKTDGSLDTTDLKYRITSKVLYFYDSKGLPIQEKELDGDGNLMSLINYEYMFY